MSYQQHKSDQLVAVAQTATAVRAEMFSHNAIFECLKFEGLGCQTNAIAQRLRNCK